MTVTLLESFDGVSSVAQLTNQAVLSLALGNKWFLSASGVDAQWELAAGRTGNCLRKSTTSGGVIVGFMGILTEVYFGLAFKPASVSGGHAIYNVYDSSGSSHMFALSRNGTTLQLSTIPTNSFTVVATTLPVLTAGEWHYIETYFKLAHSGGRFDVKVNGVLVASYTGDTQRDTSSGNIQYLGLGNTSSGDLEIGDSFDDVYVVDPLTSGANSYLGDTKVRCIRPNGNGDESDFVGSDGNSTDNYLHVDEQNVSDADYVQSQVDGDRDLYTFEDPTIDGAITAVQFVARAARLSETDPKTLALGAKLGATTDFVAETLTATMKEHWRVTETKPGGGAWTSTDLNDMQPGYEQVDA